MSYNPIARPIINSNAQVRAHLQRNGYEPLPIVELFGDVRYVRALPLHKELMFSAERFPVVPDIEVFSGRMWLHYGLVRFGENGPSQIYEKAEEVLGLGGLFRNEKAFLHFFREGTAEYYTLDGESWVRVPLHHEKQDKIAVRSLEQLMLPNLFKIK